MIKRKIPANWREILTRYADEIRVIRADGVVTPEERERFVLKIEAVRNELANAVQADLDDRENAKKDVPAQFPPRVGPA